MLLFALACADTYTWYADADGDGYGDAASPLEAKSQPPLTAGNDADCDDTNAAIHPGAREACNQFDDDCDGEVDEPGADGEGVLYADADGDVYGGESTGFGCPDGSSADNELDCDDADPTVSPEGAEVCENGADDDCDGPEDCRYGAEAPLHAALSVFTGVGSGDLAARALAGPGDVDGDGRSDLLVSSFRNDDAGEDAGALYLVLDAAGGDGSLSAAAHSWTGEDAGDYAGYAISAAGDLDGDGLGDLVVGAFTADPGGAATGAAYALHSDGLASGSLAGADLRFLGSAADDHFGVSVAGAGDVDGDGSADLLVGAWQADLGGTDNGVAYLFRGPFTEGDIDADDYDAAFAGRDDAETAAFSLSGAGDTDGDGISEILVGSHLADLGGTDAGAAFLVPGDLDGPWYLDAAGAWIVGENPYDYAGWSVAGAGDVDADGYDDLLVGAYGNDRQQPEGGAAYLVKGPVEGTFDLAAATAVLYGTSSGELLGYAVATAGDVDQDGYADVLAGAPGADVSGYTNVGRAALAHGPLAGTYRADEVGGFFTGEGLDDEFGRSLAALGDVDDDTYGDFAISAQWSDRAVADGGAVWVFPGTGL